jgi:phage tail sheath gpL-like
MGLTGIPSASPIPRRAREFRPASGTGVTSTNLRPVVLVGGKLSAGSETVETLGGPITSLADCYARFGRRSEVAWMYRSYIAVDVAALIYAVAIAEGGGAAASTCSFQVNLASTTLTVVNVDSCKGRLQVNVGATDSPQTIATNVVAAINLDPDLPFSAALDTTASTVASGSNGQAAPGTSNQIVLASASGFPTAGVVLIGSINALISYTGISTNTLTGTTLLSGSGTLATSQTVTVQGKANITTSQKGPRSAGWINNLRMAVADPTNAATITKSSVSAGTTADDVTNAITAVDTSTFTYHVVAPTSTSSVTSSDGGIGQYSAYIASAISPPNGKDCMGIFAVDGTSAQAVAVTGSATVNSVWMKCYRVKGNDWHTSMVAAHHAAIHRSQEVNYAAANLAGWTNDSSHGRVYQIPDPYTKTNRPTSTEMTTDLQGGVSTVGFRTDGTSYIVRSITTRWWEGSSSTADYRAREGHIPSVMIKWWEDFEGEMISQNQPNITDDPPQGAKAVDGYMYPKTAQSIARKLTSDMCGPYQNGMALLDPSVLTEMLATTTAKKTPGGLEVDAAVAAVQHLLYNDTVIAEIGPAY